MNSVLHCPLSIAPGRWGSSLESTTCNSTCLLQVLLGSRLLASAEEQGTNAVKDSCMLGGSPHVQAPTAASHTVRYPRAAGGAAEVPVQAMLLQGGWYGR